MQEVLDREVNEENLWRLETPGVKGWPRTARASDPNKMFILSADGHVQEPGNMFADRVPDKFKSRLPRVEIPPQSSCRCSKGPGQRRPLATGCCAQPAKRRRRPWSSR